MKRRGRSAALVIAAAFCVAAFAAADASALPLSPEHCIKGVGTGTGPFSTNACREKSPGGEWEWARFETTGWVPREIELAELSSVISGVKFKVSCSSLEGGGTTTALAEEEVTGTGIVLTYTGCTVSEPAEKGCQVKAGGEKNGRLKTKTLKSVTTRPESEIYKSKYVPASGSTLVSVEVNGCASETLNGTKELTGGAVSVSSDGRKQEFTATSGSELKLGGQAATLRGGYELKSSSTEGGAIRVAP
jgi:hypothetical protein